MALLLCSRSGNFCGPSDGWLLHLPPRGGHPYSARRRQRLSVQPLGYQRYQCNWAAKNVPSLEDWKVI
jgi:hypothetical protein